MRLAVVIGDIALKQISRAGGKGHGPGRRRLVLGYVDLGTSALALLLMAASA